MTIDSAVSTPFALNALSGRPDPVRARVRAGRQLVNAQIDSPDSAAALAPRAIQLPPDTRGSGPRRPHPGDIIYWIACVAGVCLLLIAATT